MFVIYIRHLDLTRGGPTSFETSFVCLTWAILVWYKSKYSDILDKLLTFCIFFRIYDSCVMHDSGMCDLCLESNKVGIYIIVRTMWYWPLDSWPRYAAFGMLTAGLLAAAFVCLIFYVYETKMFFLKKAKQFGILIAVFVFRDLI